MELVCTDVCQVDAKLHGAQYFVTFIDDYSWKLSVSTMKTKNQVLSVFKEFQVRVERNPDAKVERLEYNVPKTPELNRLAERMNQTIMERVRSMLAHAKLPKIF